MTLRERIADWLTGGDYSALIHDNEKIIRDLTEKARTIDTLRGTVSRVQKDHDDLSVGFQKMHIVAGMRADVLQAISAEAKRGKNPNATVRRMGKMADEALG